MDLLPLLHVAAALPGLKNPMYGGRLLRHVEWFLGRRARHRLFAIVFVFLVALTLRVALLPIVPAGIPAIHDEYSYLLQADTFASGRLANPPHPLWAHFQTFHVLQHPTYASKFFPGQGAFLALGQRLLGHPWWGVALSVAAMCAAMVWCLQGFLSPGWAFFGGMVTALQFGATHYWATSYWGGAVAAIGGCLAVGATGRLLAAPTLASGVVFGLGATLLAATRPYEGAVLGAILLCWLAVAAWRRQEQPRLLLRRAALPLALTVAAGAGSLLYYNHAVTGNALTIPYVLYSKLYDQGFWMSASADDPTPQGVPPEMRRYNEEWSAPAMARESTLAGRIAGLPYRARVFASLLFPLFFLAAFVAPVAFCANRRVRAPLLATAAVLAASLTYLWTAPHYFAPALGLFAVAWLGVYRWLRTVKIFGRPVGLSLVRLLPLVLVFFTVKGVMDYPRRATSDNQRQGEIRRQIEDKLEALPGKHLVVVTYAPDSNVHAEWVYNRADIDHARVVWARDLGPEKNKDLFAYFKDRDRFCAHISARNIDFRACPEPGKDAAAPQPAP